MSDKARRLFPIALTFAPGDIPSASKLTGLSTQTRSGFALVEKMLGDLWNQSGDAVLSPASNIQLNSLYITNLARMIGDSANLNQLIPAVNSTIDEYTDTDVGLLYTDSTRGYVRLKPASGTTFAVAGGGVAVTGTMETSATDVDGTGKWYVDEEGAFYSYDAIPTGLRITYKPETTPDIDTTQKWNVIPDHSMWGGNYGGIKISYINDTDDSAGYHIWLPPRLKVTTSSKSVRTGPEGPDDNVYNTTATPDSGDRLFWQDETADASLTNGVHYRYNFPSSVISGYAAGTTLPAGYIYIWDSEVGTIIEGCSFYIPTDTTQAPFKLKVTGEGLADAFGSGIVVTPTATQFVTGDSTQIYTDYSSRFHIIVAGASITKNLLRLKTQFVNHSHKNSEGGKPVSHGDLDNLVTPPWNAGTTHYPSAMTGVSFQPSHWDNDDHPQYLHRGGSTGSAGTYRDPYDNAVFDQLHVAHQTAGTIDYFGKLYMASDTFKIRPGTTDTIMNLGNFDLTTRILLNSAADKDWIHFVLPSGKATMFDRSLAFSSNSDGRIYYGATLGSLTSNYLEFTGSDLWNFHSSGNLTSSSIYAGSHGIARTSGGAQNLKFVDNAGAAFNSNIQYAAIHASAFESVTGNSAYALYPISGGAYLEGAGAGTGNTFQASLDIPNGAKITALGLVGSASTAPSSITLKVYRVDTGGVLAQVGSTLTRTASATVAQELTGTYADTSTVLSNGTIDKSQYGYFIEVFIEGAVTKGRLYWAQVWYTMPELAW